MQWKGTLGSTLQQRRKIEHTVREKSGEVDCGDACGLCPSLREAIPKEKSQNCGLIPYGGGAQPHSIAFGGVFPNITEAILVDEISTKVIIYPPKVIT